MSRKIYSFARVGAALGVIHGDGECGFNQAKSPTICRKCPFASSKIELADIGQLTVTPRPVFTNQPEVS
jgi:hypothetical protein